MGECADGEIALSRQPVGQETQHHTLSCAWIPTDKGETTLAHQTILDAPAEAVNPAGLQQRLRGQFGREWIELEAVETEQLLVHDEGSSSTVADLWRRIRPSAYSAEGRPHRAAAVRWLPRSP